MTAIDRDTGDRGIVVWVGVDTLSLMRLGAMRPRPVSIADLIPDFSDPAPLGCLLALVREAWGNPTAHVGHSTSMDYPGWTVWFHDGEGSVGPRDAEHKALLAALEAAP